MRRVCEDCGGTTFKGSRHEFHKLMEIGNYSRGWKDVCHTSSKRGNSLELANMEINSVLRWKENRGGTHHGDLERLPERSLLETLLMQDYGRTIDNFRVQRMMGILPIRGKATAENIPSKKNKSMFSQERYQFMLAAPFEISHMCCSVMKKSPMKHYAKETGRVPITAQMASESRLRSHIWLKQGCNAFDAKKPMSNPMAFWTEQDCLLYIYTHDIPIASVYGQVVKEKEVDGQIDLEDLGIFEIERPLLKTTGCDRTGCFACGFGQHHEKPCDSRIQKIIDFSNPNLADWMLRGGHFNEETGLWEPYKGLGMWFVYEWVNIHGNFNIWYPNREYYIEKNSTEETKRYLE